MRKISKYVAAGLTLCLVGSTPFLATNMADAQDAPIQVIVGGGEDDIAVNIFRAKEVTVEVDTVVHFEWEYEEPHTVTFGIPTGNPTVPTPGAGTEIVNFTGTEFISSGFVTGEGEAIDIRFSTVGEFDYFCVLHPTMVGTVNVVTAGGDVDTQTEIDARGDAEYATFLAAVKAVAAALTAEPQSVTPKGNGGYIYEIIVGVDTMDSAVNRYFPKTQAITTLDTIKWVAVEPTPHTVTFGEMGPPMGDPTEVAPIVPEDNVWDGTGVVHSGTLGTGWDGGTSFELSFSEAGTYDYYCYLHVSLGQMGEITVADPATPTPTATATTTVTATPTTPTPAPTNTPAPTSTPMPTNTAVPTATTVPPTATTAPATNTPVPSVIPGPPNTGEGMSSSNSSSFTFLAAAGALLALGAAGLTFATRRK